MKRNCILIAITAGLLLLGVLGLLASPPSGTVAVITQDGVERYRIDLSKVTTPYTIQLSGTDGSENTIRIEPGAISMQAANCPDGLCTRMSPLPAGGTPIVCLPHSIVITIEDAAPSEHSGVDVRVCRQLDERRCP